MTRAELNAKYGDVELTLESYYKYVFCFVGRTDDGGKLSAAYGGDPYDIYKFNYDARRNCTIKTLHPKYVFIDMKEIFDEETGGDDE